MKKLILIALGMLQISNISAQTSSASCITATPICDGTINTFPSSTNTTAQTGPNYGCLASQPNPAWFYFKIETSGSISIDISQIAIAGGGVDVDFICWGPFTSPTAPCSGALISSTAVDCSYSTASTETADVPSGVAGEYYILMITNYSNMPANVTFSVNPTSTGSISCTEACVTHPYYNSPLCVNGSLQLLSTNHFGVGNYSWTGPNGFTSSLENPVIPVVDGTASGYYYVNYTRDSTCNVTDSVMVHVDTCGTLTGNVFGDGNTNCMFDSTENRMENIQLKLSQSGVFAGYAWTDIFGYYFFDVSPGTYTLEVVPSFATPISCPASMPHTATVSALSISTENFAIDCNALDFSATGMWAPGIAFFPGQTKTLYPCAASLGPDCSSTPAPGSLTMILDPLVHYAGPYMSYAAPDTVITSPTGDTLIWNIADVNTISVYGYTNFPFNYTTDISATIGDTVHITEMVSTTGIDVDGSNNAYTRTFVVGNSYDPNSKEVVPKGSGPQGFIPASTPRLEYLVNFQNTGTAPAQNIFILDTLDADVDVNTLRVISSSHSQTTTLLPGNVLKFNFSNIMLADSNSNEAMSHGFVKYAIAPKAGLLPGTEIRNTAYIYFDYNSPIITNTALNTIEFPTGITDNGDYQIGIYPNPSSSIVNVVFEDKMSRTFSLKIFNVEGQLIYMDELSNFNGRYTNSIDLGNQAKGVYLMQINTDKQSIHKKLIRN